MARNLLAVCLAVVPARLSAADPPPTPANRPKVKIAFDRASFQVSYGQTAEFCMKVDPPTRFKPKVRFASSPAGALEGKFGGAASCPDASFNSIQVKASTATACAASPNLLIKVNNKTVVGGTLPATVILPTSETMTKMANPVRDCSTVFLGVPGTQYDFVDQWLVTEAAASAGLNLTGVPFREDLTVLSNNCTGVVGRFLPVGQTSSNPGLLPGNGVSQPNQWIDLIGFCGSESVRAGETPPRNCSVSRRQAITVGSCFVQNNTQTISFDASGNVSTNRAPQ